jgi:RNA polymerase sigma factor (sigma-70 family)
LFERHSRALYGFCLHRLGSREEAEDAVQTTFLNAFRGLQRGVVPEAEAAWLFKIAENVCLTRRRSAWRRGRVESPNDMQVLQEVTPARQADRGDELIPLGDALAAMPENQRRAILLREWQGLSYKEISAEMDVSQSAVETLIFRARRSLANALETPTDARRRAGQAGQAFNLASLLGWLKGLFAGGTAAKVAIVAVAATGTAALAVADARHPEGTQPRAEHVATWRAEGLDLARRERLDRVVRPIPATPAEEPRPAAQRAATQPDAGRGSAPPKASHGAARSPGSSTSSTSSTRAEPREARPAQEQASPPLPPASDHVGAAAPEPATTSKPKPKPKPRQAKSRPKARPKPRVANAKPERDPKPNADKPDKPKPAPAATAPPQPQQAPPPPPEKDKEKSNGG